MLGYLEGTMSTVKMLILVTKKHKKKKIRFLKFLFLMDWFRFCLTTLLKEKGSHPTISGQNYYTLVWIFLCVKVLVLKFAFSYIYFHRVWIIVNKYGFLECIVSNWHFYGF